MIKSKSFRSAVLLIIGLALIYSAGYMQAHHFDGEFFEITVTVIGHVGIAFLIVFITFIAYEKLKEEEEKKKMDRIGKDVFSETIGTIVPSALKEEIVDVLRNTGFIKKFYIYRIFIETDESGEIIGYENILEYKVKNLSYKNKSYIVRSGFSSVDEHTDPRCKIDGKDVVLELTKKPIKDIGIDTKEFLKEIPLKCKEESKVVVSYKVKLKASSKISNTVVMIEPCEKVIVKISADKKLNLDKSFNIGVSAFSSGDFVDDENIIHESHIAKIYNKCMLPYQGFGVEISRKNNK